ncbi:MAG: hypothetical protein H6741_12490 [Alphaproteobacteria bacterium]|nr:hypothetical protein [Alphaproteobacteria bacterium]
MADWARELVPRKRRGEPDGAAVPGQKVTIAAGYASGHDDLAPCRADGVANLEDFTWR